LTRNNYSFSISSINLIALHYPNQEVSLKHDKIVKLLEKDVHKAEIVYHEATSPDNQLK